MRRFPFLYRLLPVLMLIALVLIAYWFVARPYQLQWGATPEEITRAMPGNELNPQPTFLATRAITIDATPAEIWPWLIQMGYGRAGFYGYDILENLGSPAGLLSADRILPEFQHFVAGDDVPISAVAMMRFYAVEPNQYLIWSGTTGQYPGGFTWMLYPVNDHQTRLVSRIRWSYHLTPPDVLALDLFTEFTDHLAVRKILMGVKDRAAGRSEAIVPQTIEFLILLATALLFLALLILLLIRPFTWTRWLIGLAAGLVWLVTWYAPIPISIGAVLSVAVVWGWRRATVQIGMPSLPT
jgi:hypothetical protein